MGLGIGVAKALHGTHEDGANLILGNLEEKRVLQGILGNLTQLLKILAQHLDLLGAGHDAAIRAPPNDFVSLNGRGWWLGYRHDLVLMAKIWPLVCRDAVF